MKKDALEQQRELLSRMVDIYGILDPKVLRQSEKLDKLVLEHQKAMGKNSSKGSLIEKHLRELILSRFGAMCNVIEAARLYHQKENHKNWVLLDEAINSLDKEEEAI